jgi:hypothetical protein
MKRIIFLYCLIIISSASFAQQITTPYGFPVKPGSEKWQAFKSVDDMYSACQIPDGILSNLSTEALIQTCLDYPAAGVLVIHNTPQQGFNEWKERFNGINELYKRKDASQELLSLYKNFNIDAFNNLTTDYSKGEFSFRLKRMEIIIVQDSLLNKLTNSQLKEFLRRCITNYKLMEKNEDFGFSSMESTGRIICKIASILDTESLTNQMKSLAIQEFIKTGLLSNREIFEGIINVMKKTTDE